MEGRFNGGIFALPAWGAYIWRGLYMEGLIFYGTSVLDLSGKIQQTVGLLSAKGFVGSLASSG